MRSKSGPIMKQFKDVLKSAIAAEQQFIINYHMGECAKCPFNPVVSKKSKAPKKQSKLK